MCREVCSDWAQQFQGKIGGPGHVIQIDETCLSKRKYHRGRITDRQQVFKK